MTTGSDSSSESDSELEDDESALNALFTTTFFTTVDSESDSELEDDESALSTLFTTVFFTTVDSESELSELEDEDVPLDDFLATTLSESSELDSEDDAGER